MNSKADIIAQERSRIKAEYAGRDVVADRDMYAPWQPAENFFRYERKQVAATILRELERFPQKGDKCLEVGFGRLGWLADLISWGLNETDLYGIELDATKVRIGKLSLPGAHLTEGDATKLPWKDKSFDFVIVSTVFSSILDSSVRDLVVGEITRVLADKGIVIWYDLAVNNPSNPNVNGISKAMIKRLFSRFSVTIKSVSLAPPIARVVVPRSLILTSILNTLPFLRTHFVAILIKS